MYEIYNRKGTKSNESTGGAFPRTTSIRCLHCPGGLPRLLPVPLIMANAHKEPNSSTIEVTRFPCDGVTLAYRQVNSNPSAWQRMYAEPKFTIEFCNYYILASGSEINKIIVKSFL